MGKDTMKTFSGLTIRSMGLLFCRKTAEPSPFAFILDRGAPRSRFQSRHKSNTFKTMLIGGLAIGAILTIGRLAQIDPAIVGAITIAMIYLTTRPTLRHVKPDQSMRSVVLAVDLEIDVALPMSISSDLANADFRSWGYPRQDTCCGIVLKDLEQSSVADHHLIFTGTE